MSLEREMAEQANAAQAQGCLSGTPVNEDWRAQHALQTLLAAIEIRKDEQLMAEVREFVKTQRDRLMGLLDQI